MIIPTMLTTGITSIPQIVVAAGIICKGIIKTAWCYLVLVPNISVIGFAPAVAAKQRLG